MLPFTLVAWAERSVPASLAAVLNSLSPVFAYLLGLGVARQQIGGALKLFGVCAGLAGVFSIVGVEALADLGDQVLPQLALVLASVSYGAAALFGRRFHRLDPMVTAAGSVISGAALLIPTSLMLDRPWTLHPSASSLNALLGLSLLSTALAFSLYFKLLKRLGPVATATQAFIRVPIGVGLALLTLGERPSPTIWIGLPLVVVGVLATSLPDKAHQPHRPEQRN